MQLEFEFKLGMMTEFLAKECLQYYSAIEKELESLSKSESDLRLILGNKEKDNCKINDIVVSRETLDEMILVCLNNPEKIERFEITGLLAEGPFPLTEDEAELCFENNEDSALMCGIELTLKTIIELKD